MFFQWPFSSSIVFQDSSLQANNSAPFFFLPAISTSNRSDLCQPPPLQSTQMRYQACQSSRDTANSKNNCRTILLWRERQLKHTKKFCWENTTNRIVIGSRGERERKSQPLPNKHHIFMYKWEIKRVRFPPVQDTDIDRKLRWLTKRDLIHQSCLEVKSNSQE